MKTFWVAVVEDIVANLATTALVILGALLFWFWRLASHEQRWRRWIHPTHRVFTIPTDEPTHWLINDTVFRNPVRLDERQRLVDWYSQRMHTSPTNGSAIRIDSIDPWAFSIIEFFDFLTTNLTAFPANWPRATIAQHWRSWWHWWSSFR